MFPPTGMAMESMMTLLRKRGRSNRNKGRSTRNKGRGIRNKGRIIRNKSIVSNRLV